jgi:anti-sigma factor RsiW
MIDDLENLITQSLDGLLPPEQQAKLDGELARNLEAQSMLADYAALDTALKHSPLPQFDFAQLGQRISDAIAEADEPAVVYTFPAWARWSAGIAAAACMLIVFSIWGHTQRATPVAVSPVQQNSTQVAITIAGSPANTQPIGAISIGPQPGMANLDLPAREALTTSRSSVAIDSAAPPAQDSDRPLY